MPKTIGILLYERTNQTGKEFNSNGGGQTLFPGFWKLNIPYSMSIHSAPKIQKRKPALWQFCSQDIEIILATQTEVELLPFQGIPT